MKPVAYHRLAASELIKSAEFYERRIPILGDAFLSTVEATLSRIQHEPELGKTGQIWNSQLEGEAISVSDRLLESTRALMDLASRALEPQARVLDSPIEVIGSAALNESLVPNIGGRWSLSRIQAFAARE